MSDNYLDEYVRLQHDKVSFNNLLNESLSSSLCVVYQQPKTPVTVGTNLTHTSHFYFPPKSVTHSPMWHIYAFYFFFWMTYSPKDMALQIYKILQKNPCGSRKPTSHLEGVHLSPHQMEVRVTCRRSSQLWPTAWRWTRPSPVCSGCPLRSPMCCSESAPYLKPASR